MKTFIAKCNYNVVKVSDRFEDANDRIRLQRCIRNESDNEKSYTILAKDFSQATDIAKSHYFNQFGKNVSSIEVRQIIKNILPVTSKVVETNILQVA